jgi:diguanylate cyclase (GGDEF)-like protein
MPNGDEGRDSSGQASEAVLRGALAALPIGLEILSPDGRRVFANPTAERRLDALADDGAESETLVLDGRATRIERRAFAAEGRAYRARATIDVDDQRKLQDELFQHAYFDPLTGLPTRGLFEQAVAQAAREAAARPTFAVAAIGLDQFDAVNEYYGRSVGDALLAEAARRIGALIGPADLAARTGGDEFSLLIAGGSDADAVKAKVEALLSRLKDPFYADGMEILIAATAGASLFPLHDSAPDALIFKAEAALAQAKRRYRGEARVYDPAQAVRAQERARLEQSVRLAVRDRRFLCALQPKVDFRSGALDGLEVLMRWRDENGETRSPGDSIAFALSVGLMNEMTNLLFDETIASLDAIDATFGPNLRLGFNIAAQQAGDARFMRAFVDRLAASGHARRFMIELTEEAFLRADRFQLQVAPMLREVGAQISIDDFGVGYSSLAKLSEIPADEIKVDRSLVTAIDQRPRSQALLRAIESIGEALHAKVMVEGVETAEELAYLRDHSRVRVAQGFYFSPPILLGERPGDGRRGDSEGEPARFAQPSRSVEPRSP